MKIVTEFIDSNRTKWFSVWKIVKTLKEKHIDFFLGMQKVTLTTLWSKCNTHKHNKFVHKMH